MKQSQIFFNRYEHIANNYAKQLFNLKNIAYEKDDILQEFRIKLYNVILAYGKAWGNYRETGKRKPVPIPFYIKGAMSNFKYDYIQKIQAESTRFIQTSSDFDRIDYGVDDQSFNQIDFTKNSIVINNIDIMKNITCKVQKRIYAMYLKGYSVTELQKTFKNLKVGKIVNNQNNFLQRYKSQLLVEQPKHHVVLHFQE